MKLKNKISIVTGASGGIGAAIAHAYAKEGAIVIVVNKNNPQRGIQVANEIKQNGGLAQAIACDVSNRNAVQNLVAEVIKEYGRIDILVNNAGTLIFKKFEDETEEDWDISLSVNLKGPFLLSQAVAPHMKKHQYGKIIFTSSLAAIRGVAGAISYSASKGGVLAMARSMVAELAQYGINVNLISPGFTATPMNQNFRTNPHFMEQIKYPPSGIAVMQPMDIATAAVFLASDDAKMIHGLDLIVDGGASAVQ